VQADIVLSSGYCAFARHVGFLSAVVARGVRVNALCGTSSGALVGALFAAGHAPQWILEHALARPPIAWVSLHSRPWRGIGTLAPAARQLRNWLPATFGELPTPFAAGVASRAPGGYRHGLLHEGPLVEAVLASCAMPWVFAPVSHEGTEYLDGGAADRVGLGAARTWRGEQPTIVHWVERSAGKDPGALPDGARIVRTPRARASLFGLRDRHQQALEAYQLANEALQSMD
jgi:predicted acylesterase/phospholipase RssA